MSHATRNIFSTTLDARSREDNAVTRKDETSILESLGLFFSDAECAIMCKECKFALQPTPTAMSRRLGDKHGIVVLARRDLLQVVKHLNLPQPETLPPRPNESSPHPYLAVQDGCQCVRCGYLSTSLDLIRRHISKEHHVTNDRKHWLSDGIVSNLRLRSWTRVGFRSYWTVCEPPSTANNTPTNACSPQRRTTLNVVHLNERARVTVKPTVNTETDDPALASNWIRRTGWTRTFTGADFSLLLALAQIPDESCTETIILGKSGDHILKSSVSEEFILATIIAAVDQFLDYCEDTVLHTDQSILCWVPGQLPDRPYKAPFSLPGRKASRTRYRRLFKRFIAFALRLYRLGRNGHTSSLPRRLKDNQFDILAQTWQYFERSSIKALNTVPLENAADKDPLPSSQSKHSSRTRRLAQNLNGFPVLKSSVEVSDSTHSDEDSEDVFEVDTGATGASEPSESDSEPRQRATPRRHTTPINKEMSDCVGRLSMFFCTEEFQDGMSSSALLVYFSGVLGIDPTATTFERPRNYKSKLSALIYCIRLCLLEATLPRYTHESLGWKARPLRGQLELLNCTRHQYMCYGCLAPMGEFLSLRAYGRAFARTDGPTFRVEWSEDQSVVKWHSGSITMDQFRQIGSITIQAATTSCNRLMYGLQPRVSLEEVSDRMSTTSPGYSFVTDASNGIKEEYLQLSSKACLASVDGLMKGTDWHYSAVRRYLDAEAEFLQQIMLLFFLLGGQAPRSTEFLTIECENGLASARAIYVYNGTLAFVTRHWKARHSTNQEFHVVQYLPQLAADIVFKYLVYIRPFANMLYRTCLGRAGRSRLMFSTIEDNPKPWTVTILSKALANLAKQVCGFGIGVQIYRQLSIAITEKHIGHVSRPFNRFDDKSAAADLDVVFAWQSGHRPVQRGTSYGIDGAYSDSLQPALLRVYRWASIEWHKFLHVDRSEARSSAIATASKRRYSSGRSDQLCKACCLSTVSSIGSRRADSDDVTPPYSNDAVVTDSTQVPLPLENSNTSLDIHHSSMSAMPEPVLPSLESGAQSSEICLTTELESSNEPFVYLPDNGVIVCRRCQYAIIPHQVYSHLSTKHLGILPQKRREIANTILNIDGLALALDDIRYPNPGSKVILEVPLFEDGYSCRVLGESGGYCGYVTRSLKAMQSHCIESHRDEYYSRKLGKGFVDHSMWDCGVGCQQFFRTGGWQRLFRVSS